MDIVTKSAFYAKREFAMKAQPHGFVPVARHLV